MESSGKMNCIKILLVVLCGFFVSCSSNEKLVLQEIKPLPEVYTAEAEQEFEPVYTVMKILEVTEQNGVQRFLYARLDSDCEEIIADKCGDISNSLSFEEIIGSVKILEKSKGFVRCQIESLTRKIPSGSFVRVQTGEKEKTEG